MVTRPPNYFRWTGEVSEDGRQTWRLDEQMFIRRRTLQTL
jgi:hypothetical protein